MRPNQPNKNRSRGRSNNNSGRKNVNPLSRNYESNGPDVKVRGNAAHIAERYGQLARDAQSSGDSVMAENYHQHAEHYFRILSAAQAQMPQPRADQSVSRDAAQPQPATSARSGEGSGVGDQTDDREGRPTTNSGEIAAERVLDKSADVRGAGDDVPQEQERPRARRPRRRKVTEPTEANVADGTDTVNADPTAAPQPDIGELPAFLTGVPASAAE